MHESLFETQPMELVSLFQRAFFFSPTKQLYVSEFYFITNMFDFLLGKFIRNSYSVRGRKALKVLGIIFQGEIVFQLTIHRVVPRMSSIQLIARMFIN